MADGIYWLTESRIDGKPIVLVLRGAEAARKERDAGANSKTGAMVQSYILRADIEPQEAARIGEDYSVCGDCVHRPHLVKAGNGEAPCYVKLFHGPRVVWEAYRRGAYARAYSVDALRAYCAGLPVRMGTYGDPGALHTATWRALLAGATSRTGYTHRWRDTGAGLRGLAMASVDSIGERDEASALGWGTFRVATDRAEAAQRVRGEAQCPASAEAGQRVTCRTCPLKCDGATGGRVIIDHGAGGEGRRIARELKARGAK